MIQNRLQKNLKKRQSFFKGLPYAPESFRLYEKDIPDYPFIVDIYRDFAVVYEKGSDDVEREKRTRHWKDIKGALKAVCKIPESHIIFKERSKQKAGLLYQKISGPQKQENPSMVVKEGNALFSVNLYDYLDTGLFLDHRPLREWIRGLSAGKRFLNLFSYTGSVSVAAALGGAKSTTSVDMSSTYQAWAKENFRINNLDLKNHAFITQNCLEFLDEACLSHQKQKFDLIFLDPPTFSNSKKMTADFEVQRDHETLVHQCMNLLSDEGILFFSNNKRTFKISRELCEKYQVHDLSAKSIPFDFRDAKIHHCFKIVDKYTVASPVESTKLVGSLLA